MSQEIRQNRPELFRRLRMNEITTSGKRLQNVRAHDRGERGCSVRKQSQWTPARGRLLTAACEAVCFWEKGGKLVRLCVCEYSPSMCAHFCYCFDLTLPSPDSSRVCMEFLSHAARHRRSLLLLSSLTNTHAHTHTLGLQLLTVSREANGRRWEDHNSGINNK